MKKRKNAKAMSLLITLAFIVIITILVVGFAETVRLSRPAAASYLERARADQYSKSGVENVIAILNQQTADTNRNWISQPGQLITGDIADDPSTPVDERKALTKIVPLHSGSASSTQPADKILASPNINVATFRDATSHLVTEQTNSTGDVVQMPLKWIYVRESGTIDTNTSPALDPNDPISGRYAFWADDESSKVNYNIAWGRAGNTNSAGHPTQIELSALPNFTEAAADTLHNFITNAPATTSYNFFNTPLDARRIEKLSGGAGVANALKQNKSDVTHFNSDPNTTFFNEPRIVLTTRPDRAGWTYKSGQWVGVNGLPWPNGRPLYLAILKTAAEGTVYQPDVIPTAPAMDAGNMNNVDAAKIAETLKTMVSYLKRADWPVVSGSSSFQDKYYSAYPANIKETRLNQIALNIIDYVRAKESRRPLVQPIVGRYDPATQGFAVTEAAENRYMGVSRTPYITEIGAWLGRATSDIPAWDNSLAPDIKANDIIFQIRFEVYLPKNYGISEIQLTDYFLLMNISPHTGPKSGYSVFKFRPSEIQTNGTGTILKAGDYAVITVAQKTPFASMPSPQPTNFTNLRLALQANSGSGNLDIVPVSQPSAAAPFNTVPISPETTPLADITSLETDDPRVNKSRLDWLPNSSGNTFGSPNNRLSVGKDPSNVKPALGAGEPQLDTDSSGKISDASFHMPPPAGTTFTGPYGVEDNTRGQVMSAGELGFIHTGIESCSVVTNPAGGSFPVPVGGTPWRTLRLQPNTSPATIVPDWVLTDLFTAPVAAPDQFNKFVYAPHDTSYAGRVNINSRTEPFGLPRTSPLAAVLQNAGSDSSNLSKKVSAADSRSKADNIYNLKLAANGKKYGLATGYDSPGEIAEVEGIADAGEESEELIRQTANLITTRGNVFSVYTIGQSIKQAPNGKLSVLAEQRNQAMVERYSDSSGGIHFAPVYMRNLSP